MTLNGGRQGEATRKGDSQSNGGVPGQSANSFRKGAPRPRNSTGMIAHSLKGLASFIVIILIWQMIFLSGIVQPGLVPSPLQTFIRFIHLLKTAGLAYDIGISTLRVVIGVLVGASVAIPVGFCLGWYKGVRPYVDPIINFFRALPPIALIPLVIVYFGIGEFAKISLLMYAAFFASVIVMYEGIRSLNPTYVRVAQTLGASELEIFAKVIVPASLPHALTAIRVAVGIAWTTLVAAELVAAHRGLGAVIMNGQDYFQVSTIYVGIILIGTIALLMDNAFRLLSKKLVSWQTTIR